MWENWSGRIPSLIPPAVLASTFIALRLFLPAPAWAAGVVTSCTETNLRAAMAGGGAVTFACDGTITLAAPIAVANGTCLDGSGRQVTISGHGAVRLFQVGTNVQFTLENLTLANGAVVGARIRTTQMSPAKALAAARW